MPDLYAGFWEIHLKAAVQIKIEYYKTMEIITGKEEYEMKKILVVLGGGRPNGNTKIRCATALCS